MGFIQIDRGIMDHWIYDNPEYLKVWIHMMLRARYAADKAEVMVNNEIVIVGKGQFVFGRPAWSKELGIGEQKLRGLVTKMEKSGMIEAVSKHNKCTVYEVKSDLMVNQQSDQSQQGVSGFDNQRPTSTLDKKTKKEEKYNQRDNQRDNQQSDQSQQGVSGFDNQRDNQRDNQQTTSAQPAPNHIIINKESNKGDTGKSKSSGKRVYTEDDQPYRMALYFKSKLDSFVEQLGVGHLIMKSNMQVWADDFRKMIELDNITPRQISEVIDFVTQDEFEQTNVLSPAKMRKRFINLLAKANAGKATKSAKRNDLIDNLERYVNGGVEFERERDTRGNYEIIQPDEPGYNGGWI